MHRLTLAAALISLVACQTGDLDLSTTHQAIKGGDVFIDDYAAVCGLYITLPDDVGERHCTGIQIASGFVLTASGCVADNIEGEALDGIEVRFGRDIETNPTETFGVDDAALYRYYDEGYISRAGLALLHLDGTPSAPSFPVSDRVVTSADMPSTNECGDLDNGYDDQGAGCVTLVGYGETADGLDDFGSLLRIVVPITTVTATSIRAETQDAMSCIGDAGGPAFLAGDGGMDLVAITSRPQDPVDPTAEACRHTKNVSRILLAAHLDDFIYPYIDRFGDTCGADDNCETSCPRTPDPDCDPCSWDGTTCDEDCTVRDWDCPLGSFAGEECVDSGDCEEGGRCVAASDDDSFLYCTLPCDPAASACPEGMVCDDSETSGECVWTTPSPGSQGFACTSAAACRSGICEEQICVEPCTPGAGDCSDPYVCGPSTVQPGTDVCLGQKISGGGGFCTPSSVAMREPRTTGWNALALLGLAIGGLLVLRRRRS